MQVDITKLYNKYKNTIHEKVFTENGELLISLQGLLSCEGQIEPAGTSQVHLHCAPEDLNVRWRSFYGLSTNLHPHSSHHH